MKFKIKDPIVGLDSDGEPVGGRVAGVDEARGLVTISPSICGPITLPIADCILARKDKPEAVEEKPQEAGTPAATGLPTEVEPPTGKAAAAGVAANAS